MKQNLSWFQRNVWRPLALRSLKYAGIPLRDPGLAELFGVAPTSAGVHVDEQNVTSLASYFSAVQLIASSVARVNFELLQLASQDSVKVVNDESQIVNRLLKFKPNKNYTPYSLLETTQFQAISWGNGYIYVDRNEDGFPVALWNLPANRVRPFYNKSGDIVYEFQPYDATEQKKEYKSADIIHIPGFMFDGLKGYSLVSFARQSLALGMAQETFGASFFGNNAVPGGVIRHKDSLDDKAKTRLARDWEEKSMGPFRSRKVIVLDEDMEYKAIGIPPEDSQFLESREFQVKEICRWLRVPPHMLFEVNASTMGSIEEQGLDFITHSLGPWQDKWCQELRTKLLTLNEQRTKLFRPTNNSAILLSTDTNKRFDYYAKGRNSLSIYTINDIRRREGMPIIEDPKIGDQLIEPSTMKNVGSPPAIPPATIEMAIKIIQGFKQRIPEETAKGILQLAMPNASEGFITSLLATLKNNEYKQPEPEPKGSVA